MGAASAPDLTLNNPQAYQCLAQAEYAKAVSLYEQSIEAQPEVKSHYWFLGLAYLLQGQEEEAQTTWLFGIAEGTPEQISQWTAELGQVLQAEAERQEFLENDSMAWAIRQHLREIYPEAVDNLLQLVILSDKLERLTNEDLAELGVISALSTCAVGSVAIELVLKGLQAVLHMEVPGKACLEFTEICLLHVPDLLALMAVILPAAMHIAHGRHNPLLGADLLELYLRCNPNNLEILGHLASFLQNAREYDRGIDVARSRLVLSDSLAEKVFSSHLVLRGLMTAGGYWQEALAAASEHEQILASLSLEALAQAQSTHILRLFTAPYFFPYLSDDLKKNRSIQNQVIQLSQTALQIIHHEQVKRYRQRHQTSKQRSKPLKIGYLSHCMGTHSVGFLARWLLQYHDRDRFQLYGYFMYKRHNDPLFDWYRDQFSQTCIMGVDCADDSCEVAERIFQDEIDILIDLDSITLDMSCTVLALKPAPIQISWLGWDASGLPAVDYFLADPYVLPDWAQDCYPEKIWRLPHTYIAVDGFEVGIPTLRREDLEIPPNAVIYLSAQRGFKRHPETTKLQMQILKEVPNSYFLIKGIANEASMQEFFTQIATETGVDPTRLRFVPQAPTETVHRANLAIADVVLDTFPYNGATTTLETLWMGVPLVTRVGDQFASRNSYTMLVNAGIEAGIAWNDQEYVEWGVRYGTEPDLRQQIHWQLLKSRQNAPLWNGKQFTQEVENAYEQMWQNYRNSRE